jgi:succinyl-CoA synthetase beta subunit
MLRRSGVVVFDNGDEAFGSLGLATRAVKLKRDPVLAPAWLASHVPRRERLHDRKKGPAPTIAVHDEMKSLVESFGISFLKEEVVTDSEGAARAANRIGPPVVMKLLNAGVIHKAQAGAVLLDIHESQEAAAVFARLIPKGRPAFASRVLVQAQVRPDIELFLGYRWDSEVGPLMMLGFGGGTIEIDRDIAIGIAPLTRTDLVRMIGSLRGQKRLDVHSAAGVASVRQEFLRSAIAFSRLVGKHWGDFESIEINPLAIVRSPSGSVQAVALDVRATPWLAKEMPAVTLRKRR